MDFRARPPARRRLRFATERDARGAPERSDKDMAVYRQGDACGFPKPAGRRWIALRITDDKYAGPSQMSPNYQRSLTVHEPSLLLPSSSRTGAILRKQAWALPRRGCRTFRRETFDVTRSCGHTKRRGPEATSRIAMSLPKLEFAKTGRSTCRECGEGIAQGVMRVGIEAFVAGRVWCVRSSQPLPYRT